MTVNELFPNIPSPERDKRLALISDANAYIKLHGSPEKAIEYLEQECKYYSAYDHSNYYKEVIKQIKNK